MIPAIVPTYLDVVAPVLWVAERRVQVLDGELLLTLVLEPDQELDGLAAGQLHRRGGDLPGLGEEQESVGVDVDDLLAAVVLLGGVIVGTSGAVLQNGAVLAQLSICIENLRLKMGK